MQKSILTTAAIVAVSTSTTFAQTQATATLSLVSDNGSDNTFALTLHNTGTTPIGGFWYSWIPSPDSNFMATAPFSVTRPSGWTAPVRHNGPGDGYSIFYYAFSSPDYVPPGGTASFGFNSVASYDDLMGDSIYYPGTPVGTSYVYEDGFLNGTPYQFVVSPVPEPATVGLFAIGVLALRRR